MAKSFDEAAREMICEVNRELIDARHAYYVLAKPTMTDAKYDQLEKDLADMVKAAPECQKYATVLYTVGSDMVHSSGRIRHTTPMLSLENRYTFEELQEWCSDYPDQMFVVEPKVDGASCSLLYLNHKLVKAVTRGDGQYGEDVTKQMAASGAVPLELDAKMFPSTPVEIRGEVFITTMQFDKLNAELEAEGDKPYASPRNLAAGSMKLLDLEEVKRRGLKFFVWQVDGLTEEYLTKRTLDVKFAHHPILYTTKLNPCFRQSIFSLASSAKELIDLIDTNIRKEREIVWHKGLGMQTDGVVIKLVSPDARKEAGVSGKYPAWACCFKFQNLSGTTTLRAVRWQTGRTGVVTPVGELDPVTLGGATITRVSLNNWSWMQEMGITHLPCQVELVRSGDVIPKIIRVV